MKILKITLQGINSIKQQYQIDLTHREYTTQGIFAIVGATGAGKSTLLDAICLAIYGKTPRVQNITNSNNEVMNKDSGQCLAEVLIQIDDTKYSFYFAQHRANKSIHGRMQDYTREIKKYVNGEFILLSNKIKELDALILDILKMDFHQFTRSVMLTQGNFSAFLQSPDHERGQLLEKITGTEIYAQISQYIYHAHKAKNSELQSYKNQIGDIHLLSDDEFSQVQNDYQNLINQKIDIDKTLDNLKTQFTKKQDYDRYIQSQIEVNNKLDNINQIIDNFSPQIIQLNNAVNAQKIQPLYQKICHLDNQLTQTRQTIDNLTHTAQNKQYDIDNQTKVLTVFYENKNIFDTNFNHKQILISNAKKIDETLNAHRIHLSHNQDNLLETNTAILNRQKIIDNLNKDNKELYQKIDNIHQNLLSSHAIKNYIDNDNFQTKIMTPFKTLLQISSHIYHHYQNLKQTDDLLSDTSQTLNRLHTQKTEIQNNIKTHQNDLNTYKNLITKYLTDDIKDSNHLLAIFKDKYQKTSQIIIQLNTIYDSYTHILSQKNTAHSIQKDIEKEQISLKQTNQSLSNYQQDILNSQQDISYYTQTLHNSENLILLQNNLDQLPDDTPCPLCGSTTHPKKQQAPDKNIADIQSHITNTKQKLAIAQDIYSTQQSNIKELETQKIKLEQNIHALNSQYINLYNTQDKQISYLNKKIHGLCADLDLAMDIHIDNIDNIINILQNKHQKLHTDCEFLEKNITQINDIDQKITYLNKDINIIDTQIDIYVNNYNKYIINFNQIITKIDSQTLLFVDTAKHFLSTTKDFIQLSNNPFLNQLNHLRFDNSKQKSISPIDTNYLQDCYNHHIFLGIQNQYKLFLDNVSIEKNINEIQQTLKSLKDDYIYQYSQIDLYNGQIHKNNDTIGYEEQNITQLSQKQQLLTQNINNINHQIQQLTNEKLSLIGTLDTHSFEKELFTQQQAIYDNYEHQKQRLNRLNHELSLINTSLNDKQAYAMQLNQTLDDDKMLFDKKLAEFGFLDTNDFLKKQLDENTIRTIQDTEQKNTQMLANIKGQQAQISQNLKQLQDNIYNIDTLNIDKLEIQMNEYHSLQQKIAQQIFDNHHILQIHQKNSQIKKDLLDKFNQLQDEFTTLDFLNTLIGSQSGQKYRNIVQALTLNCILGYANKALSVINDRYVLTNQTLDEYSLEIQVIDRHQADSIRPTKTLSGGETFLASLALALGLSSIQSQNIKIESLFLDEGFGTLDEETLEMAMTALNELHQTGKMIGIISHIDNLKQRISTHIEVQKIGGGTSIIHGVGVRQIK